MDLSKRRIIASDKDSATLRQKNVWMADSISYIPTPKEIPRIVLYAVIER
jgi:hypothetical protein